MWVLTILTGYCFGAWCTVSHSTGFATYEDCAKERAVILETMIVEEGTTVIIRCSKVK